MSILPEQIETENRFSRIHAIFSWTFFRFVVAAIILTAAGMKAHQLATTPSLGEGLLHARWFNILVVEFELFFGIWLIFGLLPKLTWLVTVGCFSVFTMVSFYKAISGEASCGCFGAATINPWVTGLFDLFVIALLLKIRPNGNLREILPEIKHLSKYRNRILVVVFAWIVFATPATFAMFSIESNDVAELGTEFIGADGRKTILLEPEKWLGKEFPLKDRIGEKSKIIEKGEWTLLIGRKQCKDCQKIVQKAEKQGSASLVLLEVDDGKADEMNSFYPPTIMHDTLKIDDNWVVMTPCLIRCRDGICISVGLDYSTQ